MSAQMILSSICCASKLQRSIDKTSLVPQEGKALPPKTKTTKTRPNKIHLRKENVVPVHDSSPKSPSDFLESQASKLADLDVPVFFNFHEGHFGLPKGNRKTQFCLAGRIRRFDGYYKFMLGEFNKQLLEVDSVDHTVDPLPSPRALYTPVFEKELMAYEVLQHVTEAPCYPCVNYVYGLHVRSIARESLRANKNRPALRKTNSMPAPKA